MDFLKLIAESTADSVELPIRDMCAAELLSQPDTNSLRVIELPEISCVNAYEVFCVQSILLSLR